MKIIFPFTPTWKQIIPGFWQSTTSRPISAPRLPMSRLHGRWSPQEWAFPLINRILSRQWDGPVVTLPLDASPSFEIGIAAPVREIQSPAAAELMKFMQKDLIHAFE